MKLLIFVFCVVAIPGWCFGDDQPTPEPAKNTSQDKNSQPDDWTQLRLARYIQQPFRLIFLAWDGNPRKPESLTFQVNTVDINQTPVFVKLGAVIPGTKYKVIKFEDKESPNPYLRDNASELTLQQTETGKNTVLVLDRITDFPVSFALFRYLWDNTQFKVEKGKQFVLPRGPDQKYKLIDVKEAEALIQTPAGQQVKIPPLKP